jgi:hypothetical protein
MEPAHTIIEKLGGEAKVAAITKTASTAPYRWQYPRSKGGTDGLIPQRYHPTLLEYARTNGISLAAEEFLPPSPSTLPADTPPPEPAKEAAQ